MNVSIAAITMFGDILEDKQQSIENSDWITQEQKNDEIVVLNELWSLYNSLMN